MKQSHFKQLVSFAVLGTALFVPIALNAQQPTGNSFVDKIQQGASVTAEPSGINHVAPLEDMIGNAIKVVLGLVGILLLVYIIYSGFLYMTAGGDEEKIKRANKIIRNCVIGLLILASAYALTTYILKQLVIVGG
ncbi:MAG: hypothetical protein WC477_04050 [Patescibacteria group bacterium]